MSDFKHTTTVKLGEHRGNKRIWLEGKWLLRSGFNPGDKIAFNVTPGRVVIGLSTTDSSNTVASRKRKDEALPIIDINHSALSACFKKTDRLTVVASPGQLVITPVRTLKQKAKRVLTTAAVAMFAGGGLLSLAAERAGFEIKVANEINEQFAEVHAVNHASAHHVVSSIEDMDVEAQQPVGLLVAGVPCEFASLCRRNMKAFTRAELKSLPPEAHELGDMTFWTLRAIDLFNPHTVVLECAPRYFNTGAGWIARHALARMGYTVDTRVINAADYGMLTERKRAVLVATTFDSVDWPEPAIVRPKLADLLLPPDDPRCEWFTMESKPWIQAHWSKQTAKGNNFSSTSKLTGDLGNKLIVRYSDSLVGTVKKRYLNGQGDNELVSHPTMPGLYRWFAVVELKRFMGLPDDYYVGETKTLAGNIIGQGVAVDAFHRIITSVTRSVIQTQKVA